MLLENSPGKLQNCPGGSLQDFILFYFIFITSPVAFHVLLHKSWLLEMGAPNES